MTLQPTNFYGHLFALGEHFCGVKVHVGRAQIKLVFTYEY